MILAISGLAGSGKDTLANILHTEYGFVKIALADEIKRICKNLYEFTDEQLWGPSEKRNEPDNRYDGLIPRITLTSFGDAGRAGYKDIWVLYTFKIARLILDLGLVYESSTGIIPFDTYKEKPKGIIITDVRFRNEFDAVKKYGGKLIRIKRNETSLSGIAALHGSETEQLTIHDTEFDFIIHNNGSMEELKEEVKKLRLI